MFCKKKNHIRSIAFLIAAIFLLPFFSAAGSFAQAPYPISCVVHVVNADNASAAITRDTPVSFTFQWMIGNAASTHLPALTSDIFYVYLLDRLFAGDETVPIVNPLCSSDPADPYQGAKLFTEDALRREPDKDAIMHGAQYLCYSIQFNDSEHARAYHAEVAPVSVSFSFTKLLATETLPSENLQIAIIMNEEGLELGRGFMNIVDAAINLPALPTLSVALSLRDRYVYDPTLPATESANASAAGDYVQSSDLSAVGAGDLAVFEIAISNETPTPISFSSISLETMDGYQRIAWNMPKTFYQESGTIMTAMDEAALLSGLSKDAHVWEPTDQANTYAIMPQPFQVLQPGETFRCYSALEIVHGNALMQTVRVEQDNDTCAIGQYEPAYDDQLDLALAVKIESAYNAQNERIAQFENIRPVSVSDGARIGVAYRLINQGQPIQACDIVAYVPAGMELIAPNELFENGSSNAGWKLDSGRFANDSSGIWSDLSIYRYHFSFDSPLQMGESQDVMLYLHVRGAIGAMKPGGALEDVYLPADYYIAGEITAFTDASGRKGTDTDSQPDNDPANDLFDNRTGIYRLHAINLYQKKLDGSFLGEVKEVPGSTDARAKLRKGTLQDEDDFDFDYAFAQRVVPQEPYGAILSLRHLTQTETGHEMLRDLFGEDAAVAITNPPALGGLGLRPLAEDHSIASTRTYVIYEIWLNRDGLSDITHATLTQTLPEGLRFLTYPQNGTQSALMQVMKYEPLLRVPSTQDESARLICYDSGFSAEHRLSFSGTSGSLLQTDDPRAASEAVSLENAVKYGIRAVFSEDFRTVSFAFDAPSGTQNRHTDLSGSYRLLLAASIDTEAIRPGPFCTTAIFQHNGIRYTADDAQPLVWQADAFVTMHTWDALSGAYAKSPVFSLGIPAQDGLLTLRYLLRISSKYALPANSLLLQHSIPQVQYHSIDNINVTGYQSASASEMADAKTLPHVPLQAQADAQHAALSIQNTSATGDDQIYDISYDVAYHSIRYGECITGAVGNASVQTIVPLRLRALVRNRRTHALLPDHAFMLYYAKPDGSADTANPVHNILGGPLQLDAAGTEADIRKSLFLPEGYAPGYAQEWHVVLRQQATSADYKAYLYDEIPITINSDANGNLQMRACVETGYALSNDTQGCALLTAYYTLPGPITIHAVDQRDTAQPLSGVVFHLTRPDGSTAALPPTGDDGYTSFSLDSNVETSFAGIYTLSLYRSPEYDWTGSPETFSLKISDAGSIASASPEKGAYAPLRVHDDRTGVTASLSRLSNPFLLLANQLDHQPIAGAQFSVSRAGAESVTIQTDQYGRAMLPTYTQADGMDYTLQAIDLPDGYAPMQDALHFVMDMDRAMHIAYARNEVRIFADGYCLSMELNPCPAAAPRQSSTMPAPTPNLEKSPLRTLHTSVAPANAAYALPGGAQALRLATDSLNLEHSSRSLSLLILCLSLMIELLLLYNVLNKNKS